MYSTCSVHTIENEHVVRQALKTEECISGRFTLAPSGEILPTWKRRGIPTEMDDPSVYHALQSLLEFALRCYYNSFPSYVDIGDAASLVRCTPGEDATNGFFVSLFIRQTQLSVSESRKRKEPCDGDIDGEALPKDTAVRRRNKKKKRQKPSNIGTSEMETHSSQIS